MIIANLCSNSKFFPKTQNLADPNLCAEHAASSQAPDDSDSQLAKRKRVDCVEQENTVKARLCFLSSQLYHCFIYVFFFFLRYFVLYLVLIQKQITQGNNAANHEYQFEPYTESHSVKLVHTAHVAPHILSFEVFDVSSEDEEVE